MDVDLALNGTLTAPPSEGSGCLPGEPSTNGHRKWPRCVRSSFGLRPRRECWLNLVEKCGLGPRVVVIVGLAHVLSGQFAFRQLVSSARGRCVEDRIIGASALSAADPVVWPGCVYAWLCTSATVEGLTRGRACWAAGQIGESAHPGQRVSAKDPRTTPPGLADIVRLGTYNASVSVGSHVAMGVRTCSVREGRGSCSSSARDSGARHGG